MPVTTWLARLLIVRMPTLHASQLIAFVATTDPGRSRVFYETILGLSLIGDEPFALVFQARGFACIQGARVECGAAHCPGLGGG